MSERPFKWFAAVDWGSEKHQVCVLDAEKGGLMGEREFRHSGAGLAQLAGATSDSAPGLAQLSNAPFTGKAMLPHKRK